MKKHKLYLSLSLGVASLLPTISFAESSYFSLKDGDGFKRFSISAGWLHAMPQGSANPVNINTSVAEGTSSKVGSVSKQSVLDAADRSSNPLLYDAIKILPTDTLPSLLTGTATINGLSNWQAQGTGLEADDVDTLGIMTISLIIYHWKLKQEFRPKLIYKAKEIFMPHYQVQPIHHLGQSI